MSLCLAVAVNGANTGLYVSQLSAFDEFVNGLLVRWQIPGAALGVSHNGRLVLTRGYGTGELVQPDALFKIGGISKAITTAAVLRLVEDGKLSLDQRSRAAITLRIRDLLQLEKQAWPR